ncbi:MAG: helix-turn-helix domain-containing protein, partial [Solirubrobacteraceae bacterium]
MTGSPNLPSVDRGPEPAPATARQQTLWPCPPTHRPQPRTLRTYLLDADDELAARFDVRTRLAVRQGTTVRVVVAEAGDCELDHVLEGVEGGFGLLLLDGLIAHETRLGGRATAELLGTGDLVAPYAPRDEAMLEPTESWRALWPSRFGLLDAEFSDRARPWPQIWRELSCRAARRAGDLACVRAISCHPRLEVRLDLLFWHLAERWGRVEPGGIRLTLPLTHRLLGELVAAERPSICHALGRLAHAGLVTGQTGDWHLVGA